MADTATTTKGVNVTGSVSVESVTTGILNELSYRYLVMGPTGAGKSSFIEALAGTSQNLSISSDQLAGYTQGVTAYHLRNVFTKEHPTYPVYLLDTPGFSDTKISEIEIIGMVNDWIQQHNLPDIDHIFYCIPITATRLAGTKRRTIALIKEFLNPPRGFDSITFVTTMWDTLHNDRVTQRAESNFAQLRDVVLKEFIEGKANIGRFTNTQSSALDILGVATFRDFFFNSNQPKSSPNLYEDLHQRIEGAIQERRNIEYELAQPEAQNNTELRAILERCYEENHALFNKFVGQLAMFSSPPAGYEAAHDRLQNLIAAMQQGTPHESGDTSPSFASDAHDSAPTPKKPNSEEQEATPPKEIIQPHAHVGSQATPPNKQIRLPALTGLFRRILRPSQRREKKDDARPT
ncbi:P-loop containing nucleoside triphosphate hydrolase protein [Panaeolus papilionaceus]|nr:P-loop containing nucleoside triphosphate hydrolase protein [Panaeolus papilionaceus]